jgi:putative addiction module killer protein
MIEIQKTEDFEIWLSDLKDRVGKAKIISRIQRLELGNAGNVRAVGEGVSEMKIDFGPGYRVYYKQTGQTIVLLLCGGDKSTQDKDIKRAKQIAAEL